MPESDEQLARQRNMIVLRVLPRPSAVRASNQTARALSFWNLRNAKPTGLCHTECDRCRHAPHAAIQAGLARTALAQGKCHFTRLVNNLALWMNQKLVVSREGNAQSKLDHTPHEIRSSLGQVPGILPAAAPQA
jgi:hypothetical protein